MSDVAAVRRSSWSSGRSKELALSSGHGAIASFGWLFGEKFLRLVTGFLVGVLVARYLGPTDFGRLGYCIALIGLVQFLPDLGLDAILRRELIRTPQRAGTIIATGMFLRLNAAAIGFLVVVVLAVFTTGNPEDRTVLLLLGGVLFHPVPMVAASWFLARLEAAPATQVQLVVMIGSAIARVVLVFAKAPLAAFALVIGVEFVVSGLAVLVVALSRGMPLNPVRPDWRLARSMLQRAWPLVLAAFSVLVCSKIDTIMVASLLGEAEAGQYVAACRISEVWYPVATALAVSALPGLLAVEPLGRDAVMGKSREILDLSVLLSVIFILPVSFFGEAIALLAYGADFSLAGSVLRIHVWTVLFLFLGVVRNQWMVCEGRTLPLVSISLIAIMSNTCLNIITIPRFGITGAAAATLAAFAISAVLASFLWSSTRPFGCLQIKAAVCPREGCFRVAEWFRATWKRGGS